MRKNTLKVRFPAYIQYFFILAGISLTLFALIITQSIVKPLLAAFIIALLLKPLSKRLEKIHIPKGISAMLALLVMLLILSLFIFFVVLQVKNISSDIDALTNSINTMTNKAQQWASEHLGIAPGDQIAYFKDSWATFLKNSVTFMQNTLVVTADFLTGFFLFLIAVFFFLYYRHFLVTFLFKCFNSVHHSQVKITLDAIQKMVRHYIFGLLIVILTIATLNTLGLWALGIKHALFFGTLAGVLTMIPYIGITIGSLLPFLFALATTDSLWYPLGVLMIFGFVQFLEGNFITPNVIGKQISLNPFAALLILFFGGIFFGLLGIILSLPLLAMLKIIFDHVSFLKPLGYLLGNPEPLLPSKSIFKTLKKMLKKIFHRK